MLSHNLEVRMTVIVAKEAQVQPLEIQLMELLDSTFKTHKIKMNWSVQLNIADWLTEIQKKKKCGPFSSGRMWNNVTNVISMSIWCPARKYDTQQ